MADRDLIDVSRLTECERELWEEGCREFPDEPPALALYGFAHLCMLECTGIPEVVQEKYVELDPDGLLQQYFDNVRRAREDGR